MSVLLKAKSASKIQFIANLASKGIGVIFTIVLARMLSPIDYGNLTIAIVFTGFLTIFSNFGFQSFLIQNDDADSRIPHTTFFLELSFCLVIIVVLLGSSYPLAGYYENDILGLMLRLYCLNIFIVAIGHTPIALFKKNLDFNLSAQSDVAFVILSNIAKVFFAWQGFGALCFPLGDIVGNIVKTAILFYHSDFRPKFDQFSREKARSILSFGGYTSLTSLGSYIANQTDKLLVSGNFALTKIGFYNFGYTQSGLYFNLIQVSQTSVLLSLFAKFKNDHAAARAAVLKVTSLVNFLALPVYVYGIVEAELIIKTIFTEKWMSSIVFFQIFSLDYLFRTFFTGVTGIQISFGLAKAAGKTKMLNSLVFVLFLIAATFFESLEIYAWCYFSGTVATALINLIVNGRVIGLKVGVFFLNFLPNLLVIGLITMVYLICHNLFDATISIGFLIMSALSFAFIYLGFSYLLNRKILNQAISFARPQKRSA